MRRIMPNTDPVELMIVGDDCPPMHALAASLTTLGPVQHMRPMSRTCLMILSMMS